MTRVIFHADLDAFFASVEQLDRPELKGKPVIVGASPGHRGVVSACSYEARAFGVHSAQPVSEAVRRCPQGIFLPVRIQRYQELSRRVMTLFGDFTPDVRQISIDEAFLDLTGTQGLFGLPREAAESLKARILIETGLTVSIGIGGNRYMAKLASARSKPDGLLEISPGSEEAFLDRLPLNCLWGVGKKSLERLQGLGLSSIPLIRGLPESTLISLMGRSFGSFLYGAVRGIDPGIFQDEPKSRSISSEKTFEEDLEDESALEGTLLEQAEELSFRLIETGERSRTVQIKLRYADFQTKSAQMTLGEDILCAQQIYEAAVRLLHEKREQGRSIRLLGLAVAGLGKDGAGQGELFGERNEKQARIERAVLELRKKTGPS